MIHMMLEVLGIVSIAIAVFAGIRYCFYLAYLRRWTRDNEDLLHVRPVDEDYE